MRVVLDTNVLVSGIFFTGPPATILAAWASRRFELVASIEVLAEYRRVGARLGSRYPLVDAEPLLDLVTRESRIVDPIPVPTSACDDPDDIMFLACAIAGHAHIVVTGDRALLRASGFEGVEVVTPREFVRRYLGG
jgi:putative PIN family toxin of toxin-antitoxin system